VPVVPVVPVVVAVVVPVAPVVLGAAVSAHAPRVSPWLFRWAASAGAPTVIVWPLWQRVTFEWPRPLPPCSAKATLTTNSTLNTAIAATTLRIDALRLIPILLP
jgi:hypothetical protein